MEFSLELEETHICGLLTQKLHNMHSQPLHMTSCLFVMIY